MATKGKTQSADTKNAKKPRTGITKNVKKKSEVKREPKTRGRKPWAPDLQFIEDQSRNGLTDKQIAALTGISYQGFSAKKTELPELNDALERGRSKGVSMASTALWKLIAQGDRRAAEFYLERKGGWKQDTGGQSVTIETNKEGTTKVTLGDLYKQLNDNTEDI